ncbi:MAG: hypothetical protein ACRYGR_00515 [Janthinobacterium lividum]
MTVSYDVEVISNLEDFLTSFPQRTRTAARIAINDVADNQGIKLIKEDIAKQVAFPKGYLDDPSGLGVTKRATANDLEGIITARQRPTSLARFAAPGTAIRAKGSPAAASVSVTVKPGQTVDMKGAFLLRLKRGNDPFDPDNSNIGLAIRLKKGQVLRNKTQMVATEISDGVYILYGPSVDQVFQEVGPADAPQLSEMLAAEFIRQFDRLETPGGL